MEKKKIIVCGGSFNPPTLAHERLMRYAIEKLGADLGIFVPSSHAYVEKKMKKAHFAAAVYPEEERLEMLRAMIGDDVRLAVSDFEITVGRKTYTIDSLDYLSKEYPNAEIYFLSGGDKVSVFPRWHRIGDLLKSYRVITMRRDDECAEEIIENDPTLSEYKDRFIILDPPKGVEGISSSAIRARLARCESAEDLCHAAVWKLIGKSSVTYKEPILSFFGKYRFLSNFYETDVEYGGLTYSSTEAAFQAQKCLNDEDKRAFVGITPNESKKLGRRVKLREDWETVKYGLMEEIVRAKFTQNETLRKKLIETGDALLEEGNTWGDRIWGVDLKTGAGKNNLGKILMKLRLELSQETV